MNQRAWVLCAAALLSAGSAGAVGTVGRTEAVRLPNQSPLQQFSIGNSLAGGTNMYDNTVNATGFFTSRTNQEFADDLHMISSGVLTGFNFAYQKSAAGTIDIVVKFYANDATDIVPSTVVAGPYTLTGLNGGGAFAYHIDINNGPVIGPDVWMSMQIQQAGTSRGPLIYDPPAVGTSHDYYYNFNLNPPGYYFFGGNPVANFYMAVELLPVTPVEPSTWGGIKKLFAQ